MSVGMQKYRKIKRKHRCSPLENTSFCVGAKPNELLQGPFIVRRVRKVEFLCQRSSRSDLSDARRNKDDYQKLAKFTSCPKCTFDCALNGSAVCSAMKFDALIWAIPVRLPATFFDDGNRQLRINFQARFGIRPSFAHV
jgi:hypothetical protein